MKRRRKLTRVTVTPNLLVVRRSIGVYPGVGSKSECKARAGKGRGTGFKELLKTSLACMAAERVGCAEPELPRAVRRPRGYLPCRATGIEFVGRTLASQAAQCTIHSLASTCSLFSDVAVSAAPPGLPKLPSCPDHLASRIGAIPSSLSSYLHLQHHLHQLPPPPRLFLGSKVSHTSRGSEDTEGEGRNMRSSSCSGLRQLLSPIGLSHLRPDIAPGQPGVNIAA